MMPLMDYKVLNNNNNKSFPLKVKFNNNLAIKNLPQIIHVTIYMIFHKKQIKYYKDLKCLI